MRLTLRARLALWAALATGLAVLLVAAGLYFAVNGFMRGAQAERLQTGASGIQTRLEAALRAQGDDFSQVLGYIVTPTLLENVANADPETRRSVELRVLRAQGNGWVQVSTPNFPPDAPLPGAAVNRRGGGGRGGRDQGGQGEQGRGMAGPDLTPSGSHLLLLRPLMGGQALLQVAADARMLGDAQRAFTRALTWWLPLALLLSLVGGWVVAGRLLRPVRTLEAAARGIGEGSDLRRPLPGAGTGDELARLALTLQGSYARLADARDREQAFLRAAAHDLRSPLAALTARVEGSLSRDRDAERYRADLREIGTDLTRLSTLANHLLLLAKDPSALGRAPVPLRDLAADAVDRARELSELADVDLVAPQPVTVPGDRVLLGQAIWNLTMNAVRHAPGATVTVTVQSAGAQARVTVQDDGPGVDAATLSRLGEAFYRPSESRAGDGHGLGLALARRAAELHGGTLTLASAPGRGFTATLSLPAGAQLAGAQALPSAS